MDASVVDATELARSLALTMLPRVADDGACIVSGTDVDLKFLAVITEVCE